MPTGDKHVEVDQDKGIARASEVVADGIRLHDVTITDEDGCPSCRNMTFTGGRLTVVTSSVVRLAPATAEQKFRHRPDGTYSGEPCTCIAECEFPCKGDCGCEACHLAYMADLTFR